MQTPLPVDEAATDAIEKQNQAVVEAPIESAQERKAGEEDGDAVHAGGAFDTAAYVTADVLNVRLGASLDARVTTQLHRGQKVDVLEVRGGWSRISEYDDGAVAGQSGRVARWVASAYLSETKPVE